MYVALAVFLLYPIMTVFIDSLFVDGKFTLEYYFAFANDSFYMESLLNSIMVAFVTVLTSSLIAIPLAYVLSRYRIRGKLFFMTVSLLPMIMPPFVGAFAFLFLLGRVGTINLILIDWLGLTTMPVNFIYGLHGIILLETIHLYPLIYLNTAASFTQIDPALEEAAEIQGASGLRRFFTVTLPLATPGYAAGAFLTFIWTFADWTTPIILGRQDFLATQAYFSIVQFIDRPLLQKGLVASAIIALASVVALFLMRKYVELRQYVSLTKGTAVEGRLLEASGSKKRAATLFCVGVAVLSLLAPVWLILSSFGKAWGITAFPLTYTLSHFIYVVEDTPLYLKNSFNFAIVAALIDVALGVSIAYLLGRTKIPGRGYLDGLVTTMLAIPGIIIGVGYLRAFHGVAIPGINETLTHLWLVMPLVMAIRRVPYVVRSSYATLLQMDIAFEEAAEILGASKIRTFATIILPLLAKGLFAGTVFAFITAIQEVSATMFLLQPGWETMTIGTFILYQSSGEFGAAAALGVVLMVVTAACIAVANRLGGRRLGGAFGA